MLLGCSSGRLRPAGEFEPTGTPLNYVMGGRCVFVCCVGAMCVQLARSGATDCELCSRVRSCAIRAGQVKMMGREHTVCV